MLLLQMRIVQSRAHAKSRDFGNCVRDWWRGTDYSSTLSSSFFLLQSAAACTKASTTGCGFFSVDDNCGWKSVARKKRWVGDSMARISPCEPRAATGKPASMETHSNSGLTSKLQKNSSWTTSFV